MIPEKYLKIGTCSWKYESWAGIVYSGSAGVNFLKDYSKDKSKPLEPNPHFLSEDLFLEFLRRLEPMKSHLGPLMFQFEYLNRQKMASQAEFLNRLGGFFSKCPGGY